MRDVESVRIVSLDADGATELSDDVVVEEPLEIRVNHMSLGVTMRTPGDDFDLAAGLLFTEGLIDSAAEIGTIAYCPDEDDPQLKNVVNVTIANPKRPLGPVRKTWANSSCGICGKATIDSIRQDARYIRGTISVACQILGELPARLRVRQVNFSKTGGIHAAGLFDRHGELRLIREDLGRHNAVDKVVGAALRQGADVGEAILVVSGRLGFEIAQKAVVAGIPIIASVSAPSSLAIALADEMGVTAVGFVRGNSMNVYTHPERIIYGISEHHC